MICYRVVQGPQGRHFVLPAWRGVGLREETYPTRQAAQEVADWLNRRLSDRSSRSAAEPPGDGPGEADRRPPLAVSQPA